MCGYNIKDLQPTSAEVTSFATDEYVINLKQSTILIHEDNCIH